jgi:hypothetical protein
MIARLKQKPVLVAIGALCVAAFGCNAILGYDEATVDPSLTLSPDGSVGADTGGGTDTGTGTETGSDGGTGDAATDRNAPPEGGRPVSCDNYCNTIMSACTGSNTQYLNISVCQAYCLKMNLGTQGEISGNTVGCRQNYAEQAAANIEPISGCLAAGPNGGSTCGADSCEAFCGLFFDLCPANLVRFDGGAHCRSVCTRWPVDRNSTVVDGVNEPNTFQCRDYHVQVAVQTNNFGHCQHVEPLAPGVTWCFKDAGGGG